MPIALLALFLVLPLDLPGAVAAPDDTAASHAAVSAAGTEEAILVAAANAERAANGLGPLHIDDRLVALARGHARDMALRHYFDHDTPEHESPFARLESAHYDYSYAGENLALDRDARDADRSLWSSPEHRANTLEPHYRRVGVGAAQTRMGEIFVEDFSD